VCVCEIKHKIDSIQTAAHGGGRTETPIRVGGRRGREAEVGRRTGLLRKQRMRRAQTAVSWRRICNFRRCCKAASSSILPQVGLTCNPVLPPRFWLEVWGTEATVQMQRTRDLDIYASAPRAILTWKWGREPSVSVGWAVVILRTSPAGIREQKRAKVNRKHEAQPAPGHGQTQRRQ
jgi:hypothetical protein